MFINAYCCKGIHYNYYMGLLMQWVFTLHNQHWPEAILTVKIENTFNGKTMHVEWGGLSTPGGITKSSTFSLSYMGKCSIYILQSMYFSSELFPKHSKSKQAKQKVEDFVIPPIVHVVWEIKHAPGLSISRQCLNRRRRRTIPLLTEQWMKGSLPLHERGWVLP